MICPYFANATASDVVVIHELTAFGYLTTYLRANPNKQGTVIDL
jgi:hypothetical protein